MGKEVVGRVCRLKVLQKEDTLFHSDLGVCCAAVAWKSLYYLNQHCTVSTYPSNKDRRSKPQKTKERQRATGSRGQSQQEDRECCKSVQFRLFDEARFLPLVFESPRAESMVSFRFGQRLIKVYSACHFVLHVNSWCMKPQGP